jgi:hypothetical protein
MVQKKVVVTFPCRVRRRASILAAATRGTQRQAQHRSREGHASWLTSPARCSSSLGRAPQL